MSSDDLTPAQEAEVRRLLADARHTDPVPDEVVARLDRVLDDLASEPAREATVTRLADRRRRAGTMLVAAAAVVVAGIGVSQLVGGADESPEASTAAGDGIEAEAGGAPTPRESQSEVASGSANAERNVVGGRAQPYRIDPEEFSRDARALRVTAYAASDGTEGFDEQADGLNVPRAGLRDVCKTGDWGPGRYFSVLYEDSVGWVVIRPAQGDTQVADLFLCGSEVATRSVTLPVR